MKKPARRGAVVYGPYPPLPGEAAAATLGDVRRLLAGGAEVRVVSPAPSAAHDDADLRRPAGALRFARRAVGAEQLILRLDAQLLTSKAQREQLPARLAVAAALRSAGRSTVHVPGGSITLPAAWSRVLAAADEVVAGEGPERNGATATGGGSGPGLATGMTGPAEGHPAWDLPAEPTKEALEAEIARRAAGRQAAGRAGTSAAPADPAAVPPWASTRPLRALPYLGPEPPRSARRVPHLVKQVVSRLVDWRINPVIEHVNVLHRAVLDAVDRGPASPPGDPD